jgi:hypothetical protein
MQVPTTAFSGVDADGRPVAIVVAIGMPEQAGDQEWVCPVSVSGFTDGVQPLRAGDPLQALGLAVALVRSLLAGFVESGGRLTYEDGQDVPLDSYFQL